MRNEVYLYLWTLIEWIVFCNTIYMLGCFVNFVGTSDRCVEAAQTG